MILKWDYSCKYKILHGCVSAISSTIIQLLVSGQIGLLTRLVRDKQLGELDSVYVASTDLKNNLTSYATLYPRPLHWFPGLMQDQNKKRVINLIISLLSVQNCFVWPEKINTITGQPHCLPPRSIHQLLLVCSAAQTNCLSHHTFPPGVRSEEWTGQNYSKNKTKNVPVFCSSNQRQS